MKKLKVAISGMHCASCATNVERSVSKIPGVKDITVSAVTHKGFVTCEDSVQDEDIKKAVQKAGYKAISVEKT